MMSPIVPTPKGPSLGGNTSFESFSVRIGATVRPGRVTEKKMDSNLQKSQKCYPLFGEAFDRPIRSKSCMVGEVPDLITSAKFQIKIFVGYDFTGGRMFDFPIDNNGAVLMRCL